VRPIDSGYEQLNFDNDESTPMLVIQDGPNSGTSFGLTSGITSIGRQSDSDIVIDSPVVSRTHAIITENQQGYTIRDLGSTNGTFVNRLKVEDDEHLLQHGDLIQLGGSEVSLLFKHSGARTLEVSLTGTMLGAIVVDSRARHVYVEGSILDPPLARKEFDLLMLLDSRRGEAISRDDIATQVWPERPEGDVGNHEIEQCVHRLRARIEDDTSKPKHLLTIRGYGYKLS